MPSSYEDVRYQDSGPRSHRRLGQMVKTIPASLDHHHSSTILQSCPSISSHPHSPNSDSASECSSSSTKGPSQGPRTKTMLCPSLKQSSLYSCSSSSYSSSKCCIYSSSTFVYVLVSLLLAVILPGQQSKGKNRRSSFDLDFLWLKLRVSKLIVWRRASVGALNLHVICPWCLCLVDQRKFYSWDSIPRRNQGETELKSC